MKFIKHLWWKLDPSKFPRHHVYYFMFWLRGFYDIDYMHFRYHKCWPSNKEGKIISLKKTACKFTEL